MFNRSASSSFARRVSFFSTTDHCLKSSCDFFIKNALIVVFRNPKVLIDVYIVLHQLVVPIFQTCALGRNRLDSV